METKEFGIEKEIIATSGRAMYLTNPSFCQVAIHIADIEQSKILLKVFYLINIYPVKTCYFLLIPTSYTFDKIKFWIITKESIISETRI